MNQQEYQDFKLYKEVSENIFYLFYDEYKLRVYAEDAVKLNALCNLELKRGGDGVTFIFEVMDFDRLQEIKDTLVENGIRYQQFTNTIL